MLTPGGGERISCGERSWPQAQQRLRQGHILLTLEVPYFSQRDSATCQAGVAALRRLGIQATFR